MPPVPKVKYKRTKPTQKQRGKFSEEAIRKIKERSNGACEWCGHNKPTDIHHIRYKSQGGRGAHTNGIYICRACHGLAHSNNGVRRKMELWAEYKYGKDYYKDEWD